MTVVVVGSDEKWSGPKCILEVESLQSCSLWNKIHIHKKIDKMKRQRATYQMKEQDKTPEKQLNKVEIGNLPEKEFIIMIVKMIQNLGNRMKHRLRKYKKCLTRT